MRIAASPLTSLAALTATERRPAASNLTSVEAQRTPVTRADLRGAIGRAYQAQTGQAPSANVLDTLTAHASLETGSGASMYNYNFGGIKGHSQTGETAKCRTKEVIDGKTVEVRDGFRAYRSLDDGAQDYVRLMRGQFGNAVSKAEVGDVDGFAHALKQAHYYTADETKYASSLRTLSGLDDGKASSASSSSSSSSMAKNALPALSNVSSYVASGDGNAPFPSSIELSRVLDAIGKHHTTLGTVDDDDDDV